jgi:hypothetical protein
VSTRRWWIVAGLTARVDSTYHYISPNASVTLCGKKLPYAYAKLLNVTHSRREQQRLRCEDCSVELKVRSFHNTDWNHAH